jgi:hypothetical protein
VEAAAKLMVELAFFNNLIALLCGGALDALQFFSKERDQERSLCRVR